MSKDKFHITKLNSAFKRRIAKNSSYSIRSFARDLGIDSSSLSSILSAKRKIPKGKIESIASYVCDNETEKRSFIKSAQQEHVLLKHIKSRPTQGSRLLLTEKEFSNICDIHTYTLLSLIEMDEFRYERSWIAEKLNLDPKTVDKKIAGLLSAGLVKEFNGSLFRTTVRTTTTDDIASKYILKHHMDSLDLAKKKCSDLKPHERYFSTITIPCDAESLEHVKKLIIEFEDKIEEYLRTQKKNDVFKLSIQFYPATEKNV